MKITVSIQDCFTKEFLQVFIPSGKAYGQPNYSDQQIFEFHKWFKKKYPNAHVNFNWKPKGKSSCFIYGVPLNMELDEIKLNNNEISYEEYTAKWYGDILNLA